MPLFGKHNAADTTAPTGGHNVLHKNDPATTNTGHHGHTGPGPVIGGALGGAAGHYGPGEHTAAGTALGAAAGHHHADHHPAPVADTHAGVGNGTHAAGTTNTGHHGHTGPGPVIGGALGGAAGHYGPGGHTAAGTALGAAAGHHHADHHPAPVADTHAAGGQYPAGAAAHPSAGGAGEKAILGKLEHAAGTVLCSSTLKAKGIEKEREAQALKMQASELGQAERLETEAAARRERAVGHGAHPHHLGGHHAGGAPVGDTYGGGAPPTGYAGGAQGVNNGTGGVGGGAAGLR